MEQERIENAILVGGRQSCLLNEARGDSISSPIAENAREIELLLRPGKGDIGKTALFCHARFDDWAILGHCIREAMGEDALGQAHHKDDWTLQSFRLMHRHQADTIPFVLAGILGALLELGHTIYKMANCVIALSDLKQFF